MFATSAPFAKSQGPDSPACRQFDESRIGLSPAGQSDGEIGTSQVRANHDSVFSSVGRGCGAAHEEYPLPIGTG